MMIHIFLILIAICQQPAMAAIEIYAAGKKYHSMDEYRNSRQHILNGPMSLNGPVQETRHAPLLSKEERRKVDQISYNSGVSHVVVDFQQNWQNPHPSFVVNSDELQDVIRQSMSQHKGAALLVSDAHRMRILSLDPADQKNIPAKIQDGQNHE